MCIRDRCTTYLVLTKEEDNLIALLDIRHSLEFPHGEVYGHIGIDIARPDAASTWMSPWRRLSIT